MRGNGSVFKYLRCKCGSKVRVKEKQPFLKSPRCHKCGEIAEYSTHWYISFSKPDGKEAAYPVSPYLDQARDELKRNLAKLVDDKFSDRRSEISWDDALNKFYEHKAATTKPGTQEFYRDHLLGITPYFQKFNISQITADIVRGYVLKRMKKVSNTTINHDVVAISTLLNTFVKGFIRDEKGNKYIQENPLAYFPKLQNNDERAVTYTNEEIKLLIEKAIHPVIKPMVLLGVDAGLRKNTIVTFEKTFINWELNRLEIPASRRKRGRYIHYVTMTKRLKTALKDWLVGMNQEQQESKFLFPAPEDPSKYFYSFEKPWQQTLKTLGIKEKRFHDLKHTAGTLAYEASKDIYATAAFLDHADINMSKKYAHMVDKKRVDLMNKFEKLTEV